MAIVPAAHYLGGSGARGGPKRMDPGRPGEILGLQSGGCDHVVCLHEVSVHSHPATGYLRSLYREHLYPGYLDGLPESLRECLVKDYRQRPGQVLGLTGTLHEGNLDALRSHLPQPMGRHNPSRSVTDNRNPTERRFSLAIRPMLSYHRARELQHVRLQRLRQLVDGI